MSNLNRIKPFLQILAILLVIAIAWSLRWHAVNQLPVDYDEDDYMRAAQQYAALIRSNNWMGFLDTNYRPEHPPLEKIAFGLSILSAPPEPLTPDRATSAPPDTSLPRNLLHPARTLSAIFGTLEVALLAMVNPLAAFLLGIHAFTIKYTSEVMLESLPALTSLVSVVAYSRWKKKGSGKFNGWLLASGIFLGLTAASKYLYCVAGIAILADWAWEAFRSRQFRKSILLMVTWGLCAVLVFFIFDPYLWYNPVGKLQESILYHTGYSSSASEVQNAGYPLWQPLVWLNMSPYDWHPQAFYFAIDPWITLLAAFGLAGTWKNQRIYVVWFVVGLFFLLLWPTKWPQYIIIFTAPLSLFAAEGLMAIIVRPIGNWFEKRRTEKKHTPITHYTKWRQVIPWLVPGLIAFSVLTIFPLVFEIGISLTDFNVASLRDGFHGGIWREIWGGLTGLIHATPLQIQNSSSQVHYTGWGAYAPVMGYITSNGILVFNVLWTILSVLLQTSLGLGVALLLWQKGVRFGKFWQALFILPWTIPEMIGAVMWLNIFMPDWGWLALAVQKYGTTFPFAFFIGWERSTNLWLLVLLIPAVWYGFPFMMLASSIGLKTIPPDVFDAAAIDGANAWKTFRYVTWPLLLPLIVPAIIIRSIFAFNQFYLFQAFGIGSGTLATLSYNIFNPTSGGQGINGGMFAISAVINVITVIILAGLVIIFNRWSKAGEGVTYA